MTSKPIFNVRDSAQIVKYGSMGYTKAGRRDLLPEIIGEEVVITCVEKYKNKWRYRAKGIPFLSGWFYEDQLEEIF